MHFLQTMKESDQEMEISYQFLTIYFSYWNLPTELFFSIFRDPDYFLIAFLFCFVENMQHV